MTRRRMCIVACVAVIGVGARIAMSATASEEADTSPATTVEPSTDRRDDQGPATIEAGVPRGWSHDAAGARAAAISAVSLTGAVARAGFITRDDMIGELTTDRFGPTLASQSAAQLEDLAAEISVAGVSPQSLVLQEHPLTAQIADVDVDAARVDVWSVLIVAVPHVGAPRQVWRTVSIELRWDRDDWLVDGWTVRLGPTPMLDAAASVASTEEIVDVTSWPTTAAAG